MLSLTAAIGNRTADCPERMTTVGGAVTAPVSLLPRLIVSCPAVAPLRVMVPSAAGAAASLANVLRDRVNVRTAEMLMGLGRDRRVVGCVQLEK